VKKRARARNSGAWLARISVGLKPEVLDPQGKTVRNALNSLGFNSVSDVRVGKHFWITLDGGLSREKASREVARMSAKVLTNAIIETFTFNLSRRKG
jgi:phosphoribosylformylglycinamidine synthase